MSAANDVFSFGGRINSSRFDLRPHTLNSDSMSKEVSALKVPNGEKCRTKFVSVICISIIVMYKHELKAEM
jgi:hypothetical protein